MTDPTYDDGALRRMADGSGPRSEQAAAIRRLAAEVLRLRSLPVLRTCGACPAFAVSEDSGEECAHVSVLGANVQPVRADASPPAWCPLRGAR